MTEPPPHDPPLQPADALADPEPPCADALLTRDEASAALAEFGIRMNRGTLARAWSTGTPSGPPCRHVRGKPLYPREPLLAWARTQVEPLASSARERDLIRRGRRPRSSDAVH